MKIGQIYQNVPSPAVLATEYAASLGSASTQPKLKLGEKEWNIVGIIGRHGHTVLVAEDVMAAPPASMTLELTYVVLTEDGGEEPETGRYDATVTKFTPAGPMIGA